MSEAERTRQYRQIIRGKERVIKDATPERAQNSEGNVSIYFKNVNNYFRSQIWNILFHYFL